MHPTALWKTLCSLLFPDPPEIARYARITNTQFMRTATTTYARRATHCLAPFPYDHELVRATIHAAKYYNSDRAAKLLGTSLAPFVAEELGDRQIVGTFTTPLLAPMPLHARRERERGFNQCTRIAQALVDELHSTTQLDTQTLTRTKNTHHQTHQRGRTERMRNVRGAFSVPKPSRIAHRDIILLDDVITTGATLAEAKAALLAAGAREVLCVAIAH